MGDNYVNLTSEQILAIGTKTPEQLSEEAMRQNRPQETGGKAARKQAFSGLPKDVRALLSEETLAEANVSVNVIRVLARYQSGNVLDKEELFFLIRIWRGLEKTYWAGHMSRRIGLEISNSWDCLRSKICMDALDAKHMYVIVPVG